MSIPERKRISVPEGKRIVIEPVTRVEGHGKVSILLDENNRVQQARLHIVEFRGFERFIQGRPFWELAGVWCNGCAASARSAITSAPPRWWTASSVPRI